MAFESQAYLSAKWRLDGAGSDTTIALLKSDCTEMGTVLTKKISGDSGIPRRYPGFIDMEFNMTCIVNSASLPTATAPGFKFGAKGTFSFPVGTTTGAPSNWMAAHVMVCKVNYVIANDDLLEYNLNVMVDGSAVALGGSSAITYPT